MLTFIKNFDAYQGFSNIREMVCFLNILTNFVRVEQGWIA